MFECAFLFSVFFFNDTATTEIYTLSLHDALPICTRHLRAGRRNARPRRPAAVGCLAAAARRSGAPAPATGRPPRSEEHTSELQSRQYLVCRLLLEKKKKTPNQIHMGSTLQISIQS